MREKRMELAGMEGLQIEKQKLKLVWRLRQTTQRVRSIEVVRRRSVRMSFKVVQSGEIFTKTFVKAIEAKELDISYGTSEKEIETTIRNCMGMRAGLFVPDASFEVSKTCDQASHKRTAMCE